MNLEFPFPAVSAIPWEFFLKFFITWYQEVDQYWAKKIKDVAWHDSQAWCRDTLKEQSPGEFW